MSYIEIRNLSKSFGDVRALKDISLDLEEGKIYGLLGRNGAGKSTLLSLMTNRLFPSAGEIRIGGEPVLENDRALSQVYYMTEKNMYPENMRVSQAFRWTKEFYPGFDAAYAVHLSELFGLKPGQKIKGLSTGYDSIFKIVTALSSNAPLLLLDEPVLGLDANHRDLFYRELLRSYSEHPRTIVLSTHLIEEVAGLIEELVIIKDGEILMHDSVQATLSRGYAVTGGAPQVEAFLEGRRVIGREPLGGLLTAYVFDQKPDRVPDGLKLSPLDLQHLFIHLTNS